MTEDEKTEEINRKFTLGCMMHLGSLLIALGFGYYLGWGVTLVLWGVYWIMFMGYKIVTYEKRS